MSARWWRERATLARFVADLLRDELARARRSAEGLPPAPWPEGLRVDADLGADSLERMALAAALGEAIQLHRAGIEDALLARRGFGQWLDTAAAGLAVHDAALTFRTSGSTGAPRACTHSLAGLRQEVETLVSLAGPVRRVVRVVPCHHIYGFLFTVLLPQRLALADDAVVDARAASPAGLGPLLRAGDLVVAHPEFWRAFARAGRAPEGVTGVTSTAPCPDDVAHEVVARGVSSLLQVYGSSETAGVGWRRDPAQPFELMPFWRRVDEALVRTQPDGVEVVMPPPDELAWHDARRFVVRARRDAAVQVGGVNVYPARVQARLLEHPGVQAAAVRLMRPEEGGRLKAFIVPSTREADVAALERSLRAWIDAHLEPAQRPKALRFGTAVPTTPGGKPADWQLDPA